MTLILSYIISISKAPEKFQPSRKGIVHAMQSILIKPGENQNSKGIQQKIHSCNIYLCSSTGNKTQRVHNCIIYVKRKLGTWRLTHDNYFIPSYVIIFSARHFLLFIYHMLIVIVVFKSVETRNICVVSLYDYFLNLIKKCLYDFYMICSRFKDLICLRLNLLSSDFSSSVSSTSIQQGISLQSKKLLA